MIKITASTYSFQQKISAGVLTQLGCVAKAKEMGFDGIEFVDILPHDGSLKEAYAEQLRKACEKEGMPISNYTVGADFLAGSGGNLKAEIERVKKEVDLAVLVGASSIRHDAGWGLPADADHFQSFETVLPRLAEGCRAVTEYAAEKGIRTMVENHGFFCQDVDRVEKLVNAVAHKNFGLLCDMGNFLCADEDSAKAVSRLAPHAFYVHAKDFIVKDGQGPNPGNGFFRSRGGTFLRGTIVGHGNVPIQRCLTALKQAGYDGYVAIEFEGIEDAYFAMETGLKNLRRYIENA
ncbi:MAG: sugar phosphate isomerase/epimerase [Oscillospiraceae bacterium]|nr:sugar phosphate isomerase/epimerase [Oscillospiraceae bacterium]